MRWGRLWKACGAEGRGSSLAELGGCEGRGGINDIFFVLDDKPSFNWEHNLGALRLRTDFDTSRLFSDFARFSFCWFCFVF